jgi:hypothetical protein
MLLEAYRAIKRPELAGCFIGFGLRPFQLHFQFGPRQQLVHDLIPRNHAFQSSV